MSAMAGLSMDSHGTLLVHVAETLACQLAVTEVSCGVQHLSRITFDEATPVREVEVLIM